ncbi:MAG: CoA-binding protein [Deltaproteobacteria bacterium]|nr:CoA-binding protein [Deltaproteobacteria bacterium]MBW1738089.1 CoA-binding protein [Deltaproteobacteria bacterium]MBW1911471.1 CoA-binding protein [Deltaproteobacteria bacterium]MBW2035388.1 CoA-binding protein [Deltaproteobacteria bacterium]MBW2115660.1 CoA-binding protein [Deltaproteobacteria bacterium]
MYSLKELLESKNIAVVGASRNPLKPGSILMKLLKDTGFKGQVAGVNREGGEIYGIPFYHSLDDIPFNVELAVMIIPPKAVVSCAADCVRNGVKGIVISSEGFAEAGSEGSQYQQEIRTILESSGMRGFGPNTMGIVNTATGLTTAYFATEKELRPGAVGFAGQSGIFVGALLRYVSSFKELRISKGIGLGNKIDIDESDVLEFFEQDEQTEIVGMYLEDVKDGRRFLEAARRASAKKPVLLLKGGRTSAGARATASHTASMAVDDAVFNGAITQAGVVRMGGVEELIGTLMGFRCMPLPKGNKIAFITFSGAQAIMSIDAATDEGLGLARFAKDTKEKMAKVIATPSKAHNPVDIYPDMLAHGFEKTTVEILRAMLDDDGVNGIIFISFSSSDNKAYLPIVEVIQERKKKPVFISLLGDRESGETNRVFLEDHRIPCYPFPETAVRVFSNMWKYAQNVRKR